MSINVHLKYFDIPSITTESANEHGENKPQRLFASPCSLCILRFPNCQIYQAACVF